MAIAVTDRLQTSLLGAEPAPRAERRETLEDRIVGTWGRLALSHSATCPLCGGEMAARYSAGSRPVGARCRSCATELD
jgi:tRNA(Ile2) C34 agmatinyltransferase TiaS